MLQITPVPAFKDNYIWLCINNQNKSCCIVDPGDALPVLEFIQQAQLLPKAILITHHHHDHCGGALELSNYFNIPVYGPNNKDIIGLTKPLSETDKVILPELDLQLSILEIPGHTLDHIAYYAQQQQWLFCGDTLFTGGCGRVFEGTPTQMWQTLQKLKALPLETQIFCGHEYTTQNLDFALRVEPMNEQLLKRLKTTQNLRAQAKPTVPSSLSLELLTNPFLRTHVPDVKKSVEYYTNTVCNTELEVFARLRNWKNSL